MQKSRSIFLTAVLISFFALAAFADDTPASAAGVVNINTADASQIAYLPRVGASAAQRVVDYRKEHGEFSKPTDLMQVKGFGEKTFERLRQYIAVSGKTTLTAKVKSPSKPRKSGKSQPSTTASK